MSGKIINSCQQYLNFFVAAINSIQDFAQQAEYSCAVFGVSVTQCKTCAILSI